MRALNVFLSVLVSVVMALVVFELGLRVIGKGPPASLLEFDAHTGWRKRANAEVHRKGPEFDLTVRTNALGLNDDEITIPKPAGTFRVLVLGDSFTQGFTVAREDLFVDLLERRWKAEGRTIEVINAGTEGWSTDQEVVWLQREGAKLAPDLVLLAAYENDLYWNGQSRYIDRGSPKPRFRADGSLESETLVDPGPRSWTENFAVTRLVGGFFPSAESKRHFAEHSLHPAGARGRVLKEFAVLFREQPEFLQASLEGTTGALLAFRRECERLGAKPVVLALPSHSSVDSAYAPKFAELALGGLPQEQWSADAGVELFLRLAGVTGLPTLDPRAALRAAQSTRPQYFDVDWHLNPDGNRTLASFLHDELDARAILAPELLARTQAPPPSPAAPRGRDWTFIASLFGALWVVLSLIFVGTYPDEPKALAPLKVGAMLAAVFTIVLGGGALAALLPSAWSGWVAAAFVLFVLGFVAWKLGRRIATIVELLRCFALRGHWYLMPLLVVLLTIGSLLVVAASSPLIAPFIYTLF